MHITIEKILEMPNIIQNRINVSKKKLRATGRSYPKDSVSLYSDTE